MTPEQFRLAVLVAGVAAMAAIVLVYARSVRDRDRLIGRQLARIGATVGQLTRNPADVLEQEAIARLEERRR